MSIYDNDGVAISTAYNIKGELLSSAYKLNGELILSGLPIPTGVLTADTIIPLPDITETGKGFTCTGIAYDSTDDVYYVGDIDKLQPNTGLLNPQIVILSNDFSTIEGTIPLSVTFPNMGEIQGIAFDTSDDTLWICSYTENKVRHISKTGASIGYFDLNKASGISYDSETDTLWTCTLNQYIYNMEKDGTVISRFQWNETDALDQCFYDSSSKILYFDCGSNYSQQNYLYAFNTVNQYVYVACTLTDSYSVEGICLESDRLIILNDGYYHSATVAVNQVNIYNLD